MMPENSENHEFIGDYKFYSIGNNESRHDSYVDEYVVVPSSHPFITSKPKIKIYFGFFLNYIGDNTYHYQRYYSHSQKSKRQTILEIFTNSSSN